MFERGVEKDGTLQACKDLGVTLVAHSPLQQGLLTGRTQKHLVVWSVQENTDVLHHSFLHSSSSLDPSYEAYCRKFSPGHTMESSNHKFCRPCKDCVSMQGRPWKQAGERGMSRQC